MSLYQNKELRNVIIIHIIIITSLFIYALCHSPLGVIFFICSVPLCLSTIARRCCFVRYRIQPSLQSFLIEAVSSALYERPNTTKLDLNKCGSSAGESVGFVSADVAKS